MCYNQDNPSGKGRRKAKVFHALIPQRERDTMPYKGVDCMAFDQNGYKSQFRRDTYEQLNVIIPKGTKQAIKQAADTRGKSVSQLVIDALETCYNLDLSKP